MLLYCPKCSSAEARIDVQLETRDLCCQDCGETFDVGDVQALIDGAKRWENILPWIEAMPEDV